eukprot:gb/GECG01003743.1/.p1 GENE.gb/GECG01003743.1/~~gb/GECG01003743.1/.p1  ORF type:complete len:301 (+),score=39.02 gb/GECG01003743.1/:1-903(+)
MFDSVEILVKTYRSMLSEKLVSKEGFDVDEELQTLELLKMLFGEAKLHSCEVMIKDMTDSKRLMQTIKSDYITQDQFSMLPQAKVVSDYYWPSFTQQTDFKLHPSLEDRLELYSSAYAKAKNPRYVKWLKSSGHVRLRVEREGEEDWEPQVSFLQASIMLHFQEQHKWTLEQLAECIELPSNETRQALTFWTRNGIIERDAAAEPETYFLVQEATKSADRPFLEEAEEETAGQSEEDIEQMRMCENFILGMLKTFMSMSLEQIHQKLKFFMAGDTQTCKFLHSSLAVSNLLRLHFKSYRR